ncbi:hypothetical protein EYB26_004251 [Talaromyces marneffei]|uniref:uncharacterized protein n=1 Tax=Talaromyces marneffei TaxID=37727 RepID=UPI0012AA5393|nr:uncharacterized protein EYB26_004251 [Talaromyces marneffei]QGA16584.1 hypothetical protein EYB26_004251 [Talaromyces marneffei]
MRFPFEIFLILPIIIQALDIQWGAFTPQSEYLCPRPDGGVIPFSRLKIEKQISAALNNPKGQYPHLFHEAPAEPQCAHLVVKAYPAFASGIYTGGKPGHYRVLFASNYMHQVFFCGMVYHNTKRKFLPCDRR